MNFNGNVSFPDGLILFIGRCIRSICVSICIAPATLKLCAIVWNEHGLKSDAIKH